MNSSYVIDTNAMLARNAKLLELLARDDLSSLLEELRYDWTRNTLNPAAAIVPLLREHGFLEDKADGLGVNRAGLLFLSRLLVHFDPERLGSDILGTLNEKYQNFEIISSGRNSIVLGATHRLLASKFVLKVVRPGASVDIARSIGKLSAVRSDTCIVLPIDLIIADVFDITGHPLRIACLVFPFVEGITFRDFLSQKNHYLNPQIAISFARQVGLALRELERIGAYHGDLHDGNILVEQFSTEGVKFKVVDISFDAMGSVPFEACRNNDLANFKQHIWRLITVQKSFLQRMSLRKYIGTRSYLKIMELFLDSTTSFSDVTRCLLSDASYSTYVSDKDKFLSETFRTPVSFRLQRYEEITDHSVAVHLFVPFEPLMENIASFSNVYVSGNRGSGKSTYLASLAFFPEAASSVVDFRQTFGVYFPCRQGEFRPLAARQGWSTDVQYSVVTNIVVLKIIRRTLEVLSVGVSSGKLTNPASLSKLRAYIAAMVPPPGIISVEADIQSELENLLSTAVKLELEEVGALSVRPTAYGVLRDGRSLLAFFSIIREIFPELSATQFHLLFDDAGAPYVPNNVQQVINDLILTSNPIFCVKLSAEKLTFEFSASGGKILENGQDYFEYDISQALFIGSGLAGLHPKVLENHFSRIVEQRLSYFGFQSSSIVDYLGDNQIPSERLLLLLAAGRKDAYYCGWSTVWNIADRTPRNLLELVSEIFSVGRIDQNTPPRVVRNRDQNTAVRTISEKRLESLSQISGSISVNKNPVSLGRHLFETAVAIGSTFRLYLRASRSKDRKRQHLAIERNDLGGLSPEAETVLNKLITFGVLDSGRAVYAWDDDTKKPIYVLNRIYCPAFAIGFRRDDHLRLTKGKLEQLLLDPQRFMREGTKRLREANVAGSLDMLNFDD